AVLAEVVDAFAVTVDGEHVSALGEQKVHRGSPDSGRGSGHDDALTAQSDIHHSLRSCGGVRTDPGDRRSDRPANAPVNCPSCTATEPLTITWAMPWGGCRGFSYVARSCTVAGSKQTTSAAMPGRIRPRSARPSLPAGAEVILRTISSI